LASQISGWILTECQHRFKKRSSEEKKVPVAHLDRVLGYETGVRLLDASDGNGF
jgi:hypothetical protein